MFAANSSRLITKSGLQYTNFDINTKFKLYGVESNTDSWVMYDRVGIETEQQLIEYGGDIFFDGRKLDFYGATFCCTETLPENKNTQPAAPVINLKLDTYGTQYPDLMYSNNLKACTAKQGLLEMNFTHALSKVQVEISRQDKPDLEGIRVTKVALTHTSSKGELDISDGSWANLDTDAEIVISDETVTVDIEPMMIRKGGAEAYALIIPNENTSNAVSLEISLINSRNEEKTYTYPLYESASTDDNGESPLQPFIFEQNHRYVLTVILLSDGMRVLAVSPHAYDWVDIPVDTYMGQPVNFGGLMWMDRNLGAYSADCENNWPSTRGFYYQHGRNIPYIFDDDKFINRASDKTVWREARNTQLNIGYEYFFTYNDKGEKVYGAVQGGIKNGHYRYYVIGKWENNGGWKWNGTNIKHTSATTGRYDSKTGEFVSGSLHRGTQKNPDGTDSDWDNAPMPWTGPDVTSSNIAINPGDSGIYHFIWDANYYHDYIQSGCWCVMDCPDGTSCDGGTWRRDNISNMTSEPSASGTGYSTYYEHWLTTGCDYSAIEDTEKVNNFWTESTDNHPCPKGWRIPTKEDFAGIMPDHNIDNTWAKNDGVMYCISETDCDVKGGKESVLYGIDDKDRKVIYIIKHGDGETYRLRLLWKTAKNPSNPSEDLTYGNYYKISGNTQPLQYLEISRFTDNGKDFSAYCTNPTYTTNSGQADNNVKRLVQRYTDDSFIKTHPTFYTDFSWDNPTEVMQIPICGFIYTVLGNDGMYDDGNMTILRCTEHTTNYDLAKFVGNVSSTTRPNVYDNPWYNEGMAWTAYIRTDRNTGIFSGSRKSLGDQIRCVRDVNAK